MLHVYLLCLQRSLFGESDSQAQLCMQNGKMDPKIGKTDPTLKTRN